MVYVLIIVAFLLLLTGIVGSVLPAIPGLPLSWLGILCIYLIPNIPFDWWIVSISFVLMLFISILDYILPSVATKKYGGSKYGIWGTNIGLIVGIFAPIPLGFIIGPFLGAFIGEFIHNQGTNNKASLKAATGSFIGFLSSTFIQLIMATIFLGLGIYIVIEIYAVIFQ